LFLFLHCPGFRLLSLLYNTQNANIHVRGGIRTRNPQQASGLRFST
jgi:hypothetical protein